MAITMKATDKNTLAGVENRLSLSQILGPRGGGSGANSGRSGSTISWVISTLHELQLAVVVVHDGREQQASREEEAHPNHDDRQGLARLVQEG